MVTRYRVRKTLIAAATIAVEANAEATGGLARVVYFDGGGEL